MSDRPTAQQLIDTAHEIYKSLEGPDSLGYTTYRSGKALILSTLAVAQAILETGEKK